MNCPCVITPGCKLHTQVFIEPGVTSQGPPLGEAPESIRMEFVARGGDGTLVRIHQGAALRGRLVDIESSVLTRKPIWRCQCEPNESTSRVEPNLYQVWLSARRHFWHSHADKGAA